MFLATSNKARRFLLTNYVGTVTVAELEQAWPELKTLVEEFPAGFQVLADMSQLESMEVACMEMIGKTMELMEQHGVELVVRVIPDPAKDIGLNIIGIFHYKNVPRIVTCATMTEAVAVFSAEWAAREPAV